MQAMNYHKYIAMPKPVRSDITETSVSVVTTPSDAERLNTTSAGSTSNVGHVPKATPPTTEMAAMQNGTISEADRSAKETATSEQTANTQNRAFSGTREPTVNGAHSARDRIRMEEDQGERSGGARKKKARTKSMFRRPLAGISGQRLYVMPPLPPTTATLGAFKSLLLDRLRLLRIAGKFHVDSVLGIPKELQQELNPESAVTAKSEPTTSSAATAVVGNDGGDPPSSSSAGGTEVSQNATQMEAPERRRRRPEQDFTESYQQVIRSELQAKHWMETIRNTHDYQMLRSRFLSLFLWPALLSSVRVQDHSGAEGSNGESASVASLLGSGRLVTEPDEVHEVDIKAEESAIPRSQLYRSVDAEL